jgi:zinc transport system permease protein
MDPVAAPAPTLADFIAAWDLFREPVLAAILAGVTLGYLGVYIVLRRMVFVSAALSQAAGLGVAFAFYAQIALGATGALGDPLVCATGFTLATTVVLARREESGWISRESLLGWVYLVGAAGALLVGTKIQQEAHDIASILFGTAVLVTPEDLTRLMWVTGVVMALQLVGGRGFRLASFDPDGARVRGLPVRLLDVVLFTSIAIMVSFATRVLGALPIFAFSVLPAMAAVLVSPSVRGALFLAAVFGALSGGLGYVVAFLYAWPVGASQAAVAAAIVALMAGARAVIQLRR